MATSSTPTTKPALGLVGAVGDIFKTGQYSDLTINCGERVWHVHKAIVCPQSPFFAKACDGRFMEAENNTITLKKAEDDPSVVQAMLSYLYTTDYSDEEHDLDLTPAMLLNIHLHVIADKYEIPSLEKLAAEKFQQRAKLEWSTKSFADAATLIYTSVADRQNQLKEVVMSAATEYAEALSDPASPSGAHFRSAVEAVPALGIAVWRKYVEHVKAEKSKPKQYICPNANCAIKVPEDKIINGTTGTAVCTGCGTNYYVKDWLARPV
ncbi:hypothetical protein LTR56_011902 [Elasticomyces elasticus]|nr:hypothetical protein LTR56_011902 [Elasticomyces elasticus]KAK3654829.1 hypothetical protein LTR22_010597 [Elasticomyces elasticus]KAK4920641.1 hypothetical protein LTR49_011890 [Elasticomyces elasticus]KAK5759333.1 hypothetical protein LTS12_010496 [Elasticomyces elasticus]